MSPDEAIRLAARVLAAGLSPREFVRSLTDEARDELARELVRASGLCWGCDGPDGLAWATSDNARRRARLEEAGGLCPADGFCPACHPVSGCSWQPEPRPETDDEARIWTREECERLNAEAGIVTGGDASTCPTCGGTLDAQGYGLLAGCPTCGGPT